METFFTNLVFSNARSWRIARHGLFWLWWWLFLSWLYAVKFASENLRTLWGINTAYLLSLTETLVYLPCHLFVTYTLLYVLILGYFLQKRYLAFAMGFVATYAVAVLLSIPITLYVTIPLREVLGFDPPWNSTFAAFSTAVKGGSSVLGFAIGIKLLKLWYEKQRDNQLLTQKNLENELTSLKAQIHPHFLFNTLNSVYALTLERTYMGMEAASEAILQLSGMLRTMLYEGAKDRVGLRTEIELLMNYIELERLRFGERVDVSLAWNGADESNAEIAPLLLLPFVENAFKHGISTSTEEAWISLETRINSSSSEGQTLTFRLVNSIPQEGSPKDKWLSCGLGLNNVKKRLDLLYSDHYTLDISNENETFIVVLTIALVPTVNDVITNDSTTNEQITLLTR